MFGLELLRRKRLEYTLRRLADSWEPVPQVVDDTSPFSKGLASCPRRVRAVLDLVRLVLLGEGRWGFDSGCVNQGGPCTAPSSTIRTIGGNLNGVPQPTPF